MMHFELEPPVCPSHLVAAHRASARSSCVGTIAGKHPAISSDEGLTEAKRHRVLEGGTFIASRAAFKEYMASADGQNRWSTSTMKCSSRRNSSAMDALTSPRRSL